MGTANESNMLQGLKSFLKDDKNVAVLLDDAPVHTVGLGACREKLHLVTSTDGIVAKAVMFPGTELADLATKVLAGPQQAHLLRLILWWRREPKWLPKWWQHNDPSHNRWNARPLQCVDPVSVGVPGPT